MATDLEKLVVSLEARTIQFEKAMQRAIEKGGGAARKIETPFQQLEGKLARFGKTAFAGLAGGLAGLGISGLAGKFKSVVTEIANLNAEAARAGVGVEAFQALRYTADQYRVSMGAVTDGLKEMQLRADEFAIAGKGSGAEAFQRLGYTADDLTEKLKEPEALFAEIIGKLGELDKAAQIRVADEIFGGTGGEQFVQLIEAGEAGMVRTMERARELGAVLSADVVARGVELDRAINVAADSVGTTLQGAIINAGWALYDFVQQFWAFEDRTAGSLSKKLGELSTQRAALEAELAGMRDFSLDNSGLSGDIVSRTMDPVTLATLRDTRATLSDIIRQEREINAILAGRNPTPPTTRPTETDPPPSLEPPPPAKLREVAEGYDLAADAAQRLADANAEATARAEELVGATASAIQGFIGDVLDGENAVEALQNSLSGLARQLIDMAVNQLVMNALGGLLQPQSQGFIPTITGPSLIAGARANGGPVSAGRPYLVGERGPEVVVPRMPGMVIPNHRLGGAGAGSGVSRIQVEVSVNDEGRLVAVARQAGGTAAVAVVNRQVPGMIDQRAPKAVAASRMVKRS